MLIDTESELHALDSSKLCILTCFSVSFFFFCSLSYHVGRLVSFKVWCFEFFNAPTIEKKGNEFVKFLELAFRFCIIGIDHEILKVPYSPVQVLESTLFEVTCDLGTNVVAGIEKKYVNELKKERYLPRLC